MTDEWEEAEELVEIWGMQDTCPLSALEALEQAATRRMVLLGFPGTGKSTFVRFLALRMAQELGGEARKLEKWPGKAVLPVVISLGRFAESLPRNAKQGSASIMEEFIKAMLEADARDGEFAGHILDVLARDGGLVLFDGLDEVADLNLRPVVVQAVEAFTEKYARNPDSRFLVTCRTYSYQDARWQLTKWPVHELALLNPEQIDQFVRAWYDQHTQLDQSRASEYAEKRAKLLEALRPGNRRRLYEVAPFPIILTIMAIMHASSSYELPDSRAQVYMQCVELLLEKWQIKRSIQGRTQTRSLLADLGIPAARLYQALYEIAYEAHRGREEDKADAGSLVTEKLVAGVMQEHLQEPDKLKVFLDYCQNANGLLMLQGTVTPAGAAPGAPARRVYTFPHLTFEEYLAGRHLEMLGAEHARARLDEAHDRWREVIKLLAEYLCFERSDRDRMNGLLEALSAPLPKKPSDKDWRALWLAGELLLLYRRAIPKPSPWQEGIVAGLRLLVESGALSTHERAEAADITDQLWQPADLHSFVKISKPAGVLMARYPVTNSQYARFLSAPDFAEKELWLNFPKFDKNNRPMQADWGDGGWKFLRENIKEGQALMPSDWNSAEFGRARRGAPVVGISWWEANAYCKWLLKHWSELEEGRQGISKPKIIRLPLESEWASAAGGWRHAWRMLLGGEWRHAWGMLLNEENLTTRFANTLESDIGHTTPVWMCPAGKSPQGLMDMSGNVWEWQANYMNKDHRALALRGGSWHSIYDTARSFRYNAIPLERCYYIGFRVAAILPNV